MSAHTMTYLTNSRGIGYDRSRIFATLAALWLSLYLAAAALGAIISVNEEFINDQFDRNRWRIDTVPAEVGKMEIRDGALHVVAPPGPHGLKQFGMSSKFALEGDFDVRFDFEAIHLPDPESDFVNVEIILSGPEGMAHLARVNHKGAGQGYIAYHSPPKESGKKSTWVHVTGADAKGTLRAERVGDQLTLSYARDYAPAFEEVAKVQYGMGRVTQFRVGFSVFGKVNSPVKIRVDNIRVQTAPATLPQRTSMFGPASWLGAIFVIVSSCALGAWLWKSYR